MATIHTADVYVVIPADAPTRAEWQRTINDYAKCGVSVTPIIEASFETLVGIYYEAFYRIEGTKRELVEQFASFVKEATTIVLTRARVGA